MGEVFRATDEQLGRAVAVKLLLPSERDPRAAERFHREARAAARLNDPHVVSVYDFGDHEDGFFLVMELVEGRTVAAELDEYGQLPIDRAIDIVEQAAAGLAAAHREDVVHRDIKPGNLLVAPGGTVKVADFGIAHLPGEGTTTLTAVGEIIGSTLYLAPERAMGGQSGQAADVYSLGCVLYQLVTGRPPFTAEHPTAILYQHVDAAPEPPSQTRPELAGPFEAVLLRMLAKDPADRPTAAEIAAGSLRDTSYAAAPVASVADETSVLEPPNQTRRRTLVAGAIAVLATAAAVAAGVLLNGDETPPPTTDVGPPPTSSTPTPTPTRTATTTGPTQRQSNPTRSTQPTQSPTPSATPSTPSPSTPTTSTPSPSTPTQSSPTPTQTTQTPTSSPSSTPPSDTPAPTTPASNSASPNQSAAASD